MSEGIRNAVKDSCDECGKEVVYEKDDDSGLASVEVEPFVWKQLCNDCYEVYLEREESYREEDDGEAEETV
jgi:hypothetical protein